MSKTNQMDLPWRIIRIIANSHGNIPISMREHEETKKAHPEYWNELGEFDPYFKRRNRLINIFRGYAQAIRRKRTMDKIMSYAKSSSNGSSSRKGIRG